MSNSAFHLIETGTRLADAAATVERLLDIAADRAQVQVELIVRTDSRAARRFLSLTRFGANVVLELHTSAETTSRFLDRLDPLIPADQRRGLDPDVPIGVSDGEGGFWLALSEEDTDAVGTLDQLPVVETEVSVDDLPLAQFDWSVIPPIGGPERTSVHWAVGCWPAVPELGLEPTAKHTGIELSVNATGLWDLAPAPPGYHLYVTTRDSDAAEAHGPVIAERVGRTVIGPIEYC
ncbi:hypothetical protein E0H75_15405 [Kribbella capetownensis]|uniref:Uncharacterized protein n=1 Tax=Kribbella capetownensis TaxID=1572659 RepID=A0A4R0JWR0_9ACTN|nr:hypothetical protein [Kribbella capetownensis]TCC49716.1 hypothetical protein E0H75_15405 [Kribbella capetownensis]